MLCAEVLLDDATRADRIVISRQRHSHRNAGAVRELDGQQVKLDSDARRARVLHSLPRCFAMVSA